VEHPTPNHSVRVSPNPIKEEGAAISGPWGKQKHLGNLRGAFAKGRGKRRAYFTMNDGIKEKRQDAQTFLRGGWRSKSELGKGGTKKRGKVFGRNQMI